MLNKKGSPKVVNKDDDQLKLPDEISQLIQKHLGAKALAMQKLHGRGAWFLTRNNASYVREKDLVAVVSKLEIDDLMKMVRTINLNKQAVVILEFETDMQFIITININTQL
jgi:hypothetical protein